MADCMKKGLTVCQPVGQKEPRKTDEMTQRPQQKDTSVSEEGRKGKFTLRK